MKKLIEECTKHKGPVRPLRETDENFGSVGEILFMCGTARFAFIQHRASGFGCVFFLFWIEAGDWPGLLLISCSGGPGPSKEKGPALPFICRASLPHSIVGGLSWVGKLATDTYWGRKVQIIMAPNTKEKESPLATLAFAIFVHVPVA